MKRQFHFSIGLFLLVSGLFAWSHPFQAQDPSPVSNSSIAFIIEYSEPNIRSAAWSPDSQRLALAVGNDIKLLTDDLEVITQFDGHTAEINHLDWSPDGTRLASASDDKTVQIWDVKEASSTFGKSIGVLEHPNEVFNVKWSPTVDDNRLATLSLNRIVTTSESAFVYTNIQIWDVSTDTVLYTLPEQVDMASSLAWSPDGTQLATSHLTDDLGYRVSIWNTTTGTHEYDVSGATFRINAIAWQPLGSILAIGSDFDPIYIANIVTGQDIAAFDVHPDHNVLTLDWSPNGANLAAAGSDKIIRIWNVATAQLLGDFQSHTDEIFQVAWSPDGSKLLSLSRDSVLRIWDIESLLKASALPTITPLPTVAQSS